MLTIDDQRARAEKLLQRLRRFFGARSTIRGQSRRSLRLIERLPVPAGVRARTAGAGVCCGRYIGKMNGSESAHLRAWWALRGTGKWEEATRRHRFRSAIRALISKLLERVDEATKLERTGQRRTLQRELQDTARQSPSLARSPRASVNLRRNRAIASNARNYQKTRPGRGIGERRDPILAATGYLRWIRCTQGDTGNARSVSPQRRR